MSDDRIKKVHAVRCPKCGALPDEGCVFDGMMTATHDLRFKEAGLEPFPMKKMNKPVSVLQEWVQRLTFMQQSVLITSIRGPDGIEKNHVSKLLIRWLRRCVLFSAFESKQAGKPSWFTDPETEGGGSFTGPSVKVAWKEVYDEAHYKHGDRAVSQKKIPWAEQMYKVVDEYLQHLDETPHHFQLHFMHAVEILGYKHPEPLIRDWWNWCYRRLANDMHLNPETEEQMDKRLGDFEATWRAAEEVTAKGPK